MSNTEYYLKGCGVVLNRGEKTKKRCVRLILFLFISLLLLSASSIVSAVEETKLYEYYSNATGTGTFYGKQLRGQTFTIGTVSDNEPFRLISAIVRFDNQPNENPAGDMIFNIRNVDPATGLPVEGNIANASIPCSELTGRDEIFFDNNPILLPDTTYAIVAQAPLSTAQNRVLCVLNPAGNYPGGSRIYSDDNGVTWFIQSARDLPFWIYGQPIGSEDDTTSPEDNTTSPEDDTTSPDDNESDIDDNAEENNTTDEENSSKEQRKERKRQCKQERKQCKRERKQCKQERKNQRKETKKQIKTEIKQESKNLREQKREIKSNKPCKSSRCK